MAVIVSSFLVPQSSFLCFTVWSLQIIFLPHFQNGVCDFFPPKGSSLPSLFPSLRCLIFITSVLTNLPWSQQEFLPPQIEVKCYFIFIYLYVYLYLFWHTLQRNLIVCSPYRPNPQIRTRNLVINFFNRHLKCGLNCKIFIIQVVSRYKK